MTLVYGLISPHPPIILPEVGGKQRVKVERTIQALRRAVADLSRTKPDKLIIISPHEDHGFEVPKRFLREALSGDMAVEEILITEPSYEYYYELGLQYSRAISKDQTRTAIIASGDLSHVLATNGPYGFHPAGPVLDQHVQAALAHTDAEQLLKLDPKLLTDGAECGLRSILFLLGAFEASGAPAQILSYEAPFGVGYLVATISPLSLEGQQLLEHARTAIERHLKRQNGLIPPENLAPALRAPAGAFVSLHGPTHALRGCIGTVSATKTRLIDEVATNAIAAATQDPRFPPITLPELKEVSISIDVLSALKPVVDADTLDVRTHGLVAMAAGDRRGVLLPDLPGVATLAQQQAICRQKAGIADTEPARWYSFTVQRYSEVPGR